MRVRGQRRLARPVSPAGTVAIQTDFIRGLFELCVVLGAVDVVAIEAGDASAVHNALHKVIALHAILVRGTVREMRKCQFAEFVFDLPAASNLADSAPRDSRQANRSIVLRSGWCERAALGMALDAGIIAAHEVHSGWI